MTIEDFKAELRELVGIAMEEGVHPDQIANALHEEASTVPLPIPLPGPPQ